MKHIGITAGYCLLAKRISKKLRRQIRLANTCIQGDTLIMTPTGACKAKNLRSGDQVVHVRGISAIR